MNEVKWKPILCLDFDGVCHSYESKWTKPTEILDGPVPGLFRFLREAQEKFEVHVFSTRSNYDGGADAMKSWFAVHCGDDEVDIDALVFPTSKPLALVTLDDRAIRFDGTWPDVGELLSFKPWNRR